MRDHALEILVVEDDDRLRRALAESLAACGGRVSTAASVTEAEQALAQHAPDVVLLDFELPDGDALAVLAHLARLRPTAASVIMSGTAGPDAAFRLAQLGARSYLPKPVRLTELWRAIQDAAHTAPDVTPQVVQSVGRRAVHEVEQQVRDVMVQHALLRANGSRSGAARLLRVSRQLFQHMLRGMREE